MKNSLETFAKDNIRRQVPDVQDCGFFRTWVEIQWQWYLHSYRDDPDSADTEPPMTRKEYFEFYEPSRPHFLPDMYYIDAAERFIYFYEIEDTHPLSKDKLRNMDIWIADHGDEADCYSRVIVTDRYGLNHRMVLAYEHSFGPEPVTDDEIVQKFPKTYKPLAQADDKPANA